MVNPSLVLTLVSPEINTLSAFNKAREHGARWEGEEGGEGGRGSGGEGRVVTHLRRFLQGRSMSLHPLPMLPLPDRSCRVTLPVLLPLGTSAWCCLWRVGDTSSGSESDAPGGRIRRYCRGELVQKQSGVHCSRQKSRAWLIHNNAHPQHDSAYAA